jgi:hypothetical protein
LTTVNTSTSSPVEKAPNRPLPKRPPGLSLEAWERLIAMHKRGMRLNGPIEFYGRVIDQHQQPIEGVRLRLTLSGYDENFVWRKDLLLPGDKDYLRRESLELVSNSEGRFSLSGKTGKTLYLDSLEKEGYLWSAPTAISFIYEPDQRQPRPYTDPTQGVTFHMWKKGPTEPLIRHFIRIPLRAEVVDHQVNLITGVVIIGSEHSRRPEVGYSVAGPQ